ncbi:ASPIC and UnbV [Rubripirellula lacrimiformis]|uniref:ASPIC and UnbV n=1 Tax=Rubripirellula lacrimiformis TaxID=1930273 RepID=A0A517NFQ8_9BACT|nr:FG-GAP-like repeat-containing protein [Rubripirellula lacrimiformis]QDT05962.1 ASPIC and UnbV [Rubripirellula lacrimiformis]
MSLPLLDCVARFCRTPHRRTHQQPLVVRITAGLLTTLGLLGFVGCDRGGPSPDQSLESPSLDDPKPATTPPSLETAYRFSQQGRDAEALAEVRRLLIATPDDRDTLLMAIELDSRLGNFCEAAELAIKLAASDPTITADMLVRAFDLHLRCKDFAGAEQALLRLLQFSPNHVEGHRLSAQLYNAQGRRAEACEHVIQLIRLRAVRPEETLSLIDRQGPFLLVSFDDFTNAEELSMFSLGRIRGQYVKFNKASNEVLDRLTQLREKFPDSTAVAAFQGRVIAETGRQDALRQWAQSLPPGIEQQPEYWHAIGQGLSLENRHEEAIRAFGEALRRDPTDRGSLRGIAQHLDSLGRDEEAVPIRNRLETLDKIFRIAKDADQEQAGWIAEQLQTLVRPWESAAWFMQAARLGGDFQQQIPELNRRHASIVAWESQPGATAQKIDNARLVSLLSFEVDDWPMPKFGTDPTGANSNQVAQTDRVSRFEDIASKVGLVAAFQSGFPDNGHGFYAHQVNGGGLAAVDYDLDGRCDVYIVQSGGSPNDRTGSAANQLFRCLPDAKFQEVTEPSGSGDRSLGQGVCAGDINQDGFLDLVIANIGANTVLINQGDGTFREQFVANISNVDNWTSCLVLGDLSGDHLPELIEINYIDDPTAYTVRCEDDYLACQPQKYQAAADRVHQISADGQFHPWQAAESMTEHPKLGFGVVIANFDRKDGNDMFIANDGDLNHYWTSIAAADADNDRFGIHESGIVRGCSTGRSGNSQACMGVAAGDFNRDGTLDLHVTNFLRESVNLFMQSKSGYFSDECLAYQLVEPSYGVLGFGTQSADFDNDGWLDLAVLNGHVFNADDDAIAYKMQPQVLQGQQGRFTALASEQIGPYWQEDRLGRTLAMLDWNHDGKMDLLANHLDAPIALLENESDSQNWIQLELVGTTSERDAIGAEVQVRCGDQQWTGWQFGGDGLMSTNQPIVHFGLGSNETIDQIEIHWPSGDHQTFQNPKPAQRYLVVENDDQMYPRLD